MLELPSKIYKLGTPGLDLFSFINLPGCFFLFRLGTSYLQQKLKNPVYKEEKNAVICVQS